MPIYHKVLYAPAADLLQLTTDDAVVALDAFLREHELTLQWIEKERTPEVMGRLSAASSIASAIAAMRSPLTG